MSEYEQIRRLLELQASLDAGEAHARLRELMRQQEHVNAIYAETEHLRAFLAMQQAYEHTTRLLRDRADVDRSVRAMIASIQGMEQTRTLLAEAERWERLRREVESHAQARQYLQQLTAHAFGSWHASWQSMQDQLGLLPRYLTTVVRGSALAPSLALSDFSSATITKIANAEPAPDERVDPLQASLVLAESQVEGATKILSDTLVGLAESSGARGDDALGESQAPGDPTVVDSGAASSAGRGQAGAAVAADTHRRRRAGQARRKNPRAARESAPLPCSSRSRLN